MIAEINSAAPVFRPSKLWQRFARPHAGEIDRYGFAQLKKTVAMNYFNFAPRRPRAIVLVRAVIFRRYLLRLDLRRNCAGWCEHSIRRVVMSYVPDTWADRVLAPRWFFIPPYRPKSICVRPRYIASPDALGFH